MNGINNEKFSSPLDETENSNFDDIPNGNLNMDDIPEGQNLNRSISPELAHRLSSGERFFRDVIGLPDSYHVSAEHKLLFSTVSAKPADSNFPSLHSGGVFFDAFGLEVDNIRYPFLPDFQTMVHKAILRHELSGATSVNEVYNRLDNGFSMYFVENILQRRNAEEVEAELNQKRLSMVEKTVKLNMEQRSYRNKKELGEYTDDSKRSQVKARQEQEFVDFIISNNIMSQKELREYEASRSFSLKVSAGSIAHKFSVIYKENHPKKNEESEEDYNEMLDKIKSHISNLAADYLNSLALSQAQSLTARPELRLFDAEWTKKKMIENISNLDKERVQRIFNSGKDVDYYKEKLYDSISSYGKLDGIESTIELLKEKEQKCSTYYGLLAPKYVDASTHYKEQNDRQITELKNHIEYLDENRANIIEQEKDKRTRSAMYALREKVFRIVSPEDSSMLEDVVNFYFIPTGIITRFKTGSLKTTMINPLDERILDAFNDEEIKNAWIDAWTIKQTEYSEATFDALRTDIDNNITQSRDEDDEEAMAFEKENQIQIPKAFSMTTGRVHESLQPNVLRSIEPFIPDIKDFIYGLDISNTEVTKTLRTTRLEILNFLSGDSDGKDLMLCGHNNLKVNSIHELFINTEPEKQDKAYSRLLSEVGIMLYTGLSKDKVAEYQKLIGDAANVSDKAFYRAYGKMITNSAIRSKIVERTIFLKDFIDYIKGEASPAKTGFFDSTRKKPALAE